MLGVWGLSCALKKDKPRTFSEPRLISEVLKERGIKFLPVSRGYENDPLWIKKWNKFRKIFNNKTPEEIWGFKNWDRQKQDDLVSIYFTESCEKFNKASITTEEDPKYKAIVEFCAETI